MSLKTTSLKRFGKQEKLKLLSGKMAVKLAQKQNDPLVTKYMKFKKKYFDIKQQIQKKYGVRAMQAAKKVAMKSK